MPQIQTRDVHDQPVYNISVLISPGEQGPESYIYDVRTDDTGGNQTWPIPYWPDRDWMLHVNQPNGPVRQDTRYREVSIKVPKGHTDNVTIVLPYATAVPEPGPTPTPPQDEYPFPAETNGLYVDGKTFRRKADGTLFQYRSASAFLLFRDYCRRADIRPVLHGWRQLGVNVLRLMGPLPWAETPDYASWDLFRFDLLPDFQRLVESYGMLTNWSLGHIKHPKFAEHAQAFYDVAHEHGLWSVALTERVNEPDVHKDEKPDPVSAFQGVNARGIPTAFGYYLEAMDADPAPPPMLDYGTIHTPRDSHWVRRARYAQEIQQKTGKPWILDEPARIGELTTGGAGVKNDPARTPTEMAQYAAIGGMFGPGVTMHTDAGKWGSCPSPGMLQYRACEAVLEVWKRMPAEAQLGEYNNSENHDSPVDDVNNPDGSPVWTYTSLHAHEAWSVRCGLTPLKAINGWAITEKLDDLGTIVRLTR